MFFLRLGAHRRVHTVGTEQDIVVSKVITHPSYHQPTKYSHDIALLKLEKPAQLDRYLRRASLGKIAASPFLKQSPAEMGVGSTLQVRVCPMSPARKMVFFVPYNALFIDQACTVKMDWL